MDAWVDGLDLGRNLMPDDQELIADIEAGPLIDKLVLALLRRYHDNKPEVIKNLIEERKHLLGATLRAACDFCFGGIRKDEFFGKYGAQEFQLLLQAGVDVKLLGNLTSALESERPDLWWLLQATPASKNRIAELLTLSVQQRAVLGLCTPEEWKRLQGDSESTRWVMDCRRSWMHGK